MAFHIWWPHRRWLMNGETPWKHQSFSRQSCHSPAFHQSSFSAASSDQSPAGSASTGPTSRWGKSCFAQSPTNYVLVCVRIVPHPAEPPESVFCPLLPLPSGASKSAGKSSHFTWRSGKKVERWQLLTAGGHVSTELYCVFVP